MAMIALLAGFCTLLAAISLVELAVKDDRDEVDIGTTLVVIGIALSTLVWTQLRLAWLPDVVTILLSMGGVLSVGVGAVLLARGW